MPFLCSFFGKGVRVEEDLLISAEETLDDLILGGLKIIQPKSGYRFSVDALLLAHFCTLNKVHRVIDLGTGNGIIPLLLTTRQANLNIVGVECQDSMVRRTRRSIKLNNLEDIITIVKEDINHIENSCPRGQADLVVCNPPFYKVGTGRLSLNEEEAIARHEIAVSLATIIEKATYLLNDTGTLALIHKADSLGEIINLFSTYKLKLSRIRFIHSNIDSRAKLVLIEGRKNSSAKLDVLAPLIIYKSNGEYSEEVKAWYQN